MSEQLIDTDFEDDYESELTLEEQAIRREVEVVLSPDRQKTVNFLVDKLVIACDRLTGNPLRPYQTPFARRMFESMIISDGAALTALFSRQSGKALELSTKILTPSGWSTMGELRVGDKVFAPDGTAVSVIATSPVFTDHTCYKVSFADGQKITADAGHRWTLIDKTLNHEVTVTTEELATSLKHRQEALWRYRVRPAAPPELPEKCLSLDPYLLGAWLGDGSSSKSEITSADHEIVQSFVDAGFAVTYTDNKNTGKATTYGFRGTVRPAPGRPSNGLYRQLQRIGVINNKHIPEAYLLGSPQQRLALLQGLMDTDGYADAKKGSAEFCSVVKNLAEGVLFLARSLGWKARMREDRAQFQGRDCGPRYRVEWHPYREFSPFTLKRKTDRLHERCSVAWRAERTETIPIVAVELVDSVPVRCIAVDHPSHLYLAGEGLVPTHNTETVANVVATCMIFLPRLAPFYPEFLEKYAREGVQVGAFAPVEEQADNLFGRIVAVLQSDNCKAILMDPEIDDRVRGRGSVVWLQNCKSAVRKTTCHPKAKIEGRHYHMILIDEAQDADTKTVNKSVTPMGTATEATMVFTGTPTYNINFFYDQINKNKRAILGRGKVRCDHFQADWKLVAKYVPAYKRSTLRTMENIGEDSDEFRLNYKLEWLLDKGMFTTEEMFKKLSDVSVQSLEHDWPYSPVVAGIDCGRRQDKTIVTVVWVDWDHPDNFGFYEHRVINWLDLEGLDWEEQYYRITEFLSHYNVYAVGVDTGGIGDVVKQRLSLLMPHTTFVECMDSVKEQSDRFKYMKMLMERQRVIWPGGSRVKRLKCWQRFKQEMTDAEIEFKGPNIAVAAPKSRDAHDDYVDSLCDALSLTRDTSGIETAKRQTVVYGNVFFASNRRR